MVAVERLGLAEISKVLVVGEDLYGKGGAVEIVAPGFQGANNGEKFPVVNVVISFSGGEGLQEVRAGMPIAVGVGLKEDGTRHMFGGVRGDGKGDGEVGEVKDRFGEKKAFE